MAALARLCNLHADGATTLARLVDGRTTVVPEDMQLGIAAVLADALEPDSGEPELVRESAVIGLPHPDFGEAVVAVVTTTGETSEEGILGALDGKLAKFKRPKRVFFVEALPRNAMGKVRKNELRDTYAGAFS